MIDAELKKKLKMKAAEKGITLKDLIRPKLDELVT